MKFKKKEYQKDDLTIVWDMPKCMHAERCWRELSTVFRREERPWIYPEGADVDQIKQQIDRCPSGALSYRMSSTGETLKKRDMKVTIVPDGPAIINGDCEFKHTDGSSEQRSGNTALCRCGASANKPFCDGTHTKIDFKG